jgi:hypothetical protein
VVARLLEISAAFGSWWVKSTWHKDPQRAAADMRKVRRAAVAQLDPEDSSRMSNCM